MLAVRRRPTQRQIVLVALVALVFVVSLLTYQKGSLNFGVYRLDLDVYRVGAQAWMHGKALYGPLPPITNGMLEPFTYPPISAVVMAPLAMLSTTAAGVVMTAVSLSLFICVLALFLRAAKLATGRGSWKLAAAMLPLAVLVEPVRTTLAYGQINIVLMALVAFDCLLPSTWFTIRGRRVGWPRGALTGVAAALKLTPLVFLLYFVARRDWRGCLSALGGFFVTTALGFVFCAHDSRQYWTSTVFDTSRIGLHDFSSNQSISGVLFRAHLTGTTENLVWLACCAVIGLAAIVALFKTAKQGKPVTLVALAACTELLVSPVSWSHHWVWASPVLMCALVKGWRLRPTQGWRYFAGAVAVTAVFLSEPQMWFPHQDNLELGWGWWEQIIGSAYVWVGLVTLLIFALRRGRPAARADGRDPGSAVEPRPRADQPAADARDQAAMERLTKEASAGVGFPRRC
ncbi:glycosyltransferase 87 family protein [Actinospica sp.]|uniref:glycosyltransferase 87 family protein n=1 Tax=Actinospica sp. TaxID=1872142 RepID=UPI002C911089|nr:glycosyltransferase 87 family protein [Actinospica sp.]HWG26938.1 glycosyltransferase 87 family protein [Actinospica sp.]